MGQDIKVSVVFHLFPQKKYFKRLIETVEIRKINTCKCKREREREKDRERDIQSERELERERESKRVRKKM